MAQSITLLGTLLGENDVGAKEQARRLAVIIIIIINDSIYPAVSKASRTGIGSDPL